MGGLGSGRRWSKKPVVEDCLGLDTADLKRLKLLSPTTAGRSGSLHWYRNGEREPASSVSYHVTVGRDGGMLRLMYQMKAANAELDYRVRLVTTGCHLGGVRWWFICPLAREGVTCSRRVRKLYLSGRYFGCRHCHGLAYRSSQESDSRVYAALRSGLHFDIPANLDRMSIAQLGFALRVLTFEQKRLDRLGRRFGRQRGTKE